MTIKLVLFDFDGTLADTLPPSFAAFKTIFKKYDGRDVTNAQLVAMFGPTEEAIIANNFSNGEAVSRAIDDYYDLYGRGHHETMGNRDILALLDHLRACGSLIGVITGKSRRAFTISSDALGLSKYFDLVVTGDDVKKPKPDPEGIAIALDFFRVRAKDCVFLGDSNADVKAGKTAGIRTYAVQWLSAFQSSEFDVEPDALFKSTAEFIEVLDKEESFR